MEMKYISTLLYENDCVIIPGLGGFVSNYEPAKILGDRNRFVPPFKKILFNSRLTSNDGLLANHIAKTEGITYKESINLINRFVSRCNRELEQNKKVRFPGIGMLYKDANDKILFEQDEQVNYLPQAYGLQQFISPAIYREHPYQRFEKQMRTSPVQSLRNSRFVKGLKWAAVIVPIAAIAAWSALNIDKLQQTYDRYAIYFKPLPEQVEKNPRDRMERLNEARDYIQDNDNFSVNTSSIVPSGTNKADNESPSGAGYNRDANPEKTTKNVVKSRQTPPAASDSPSKQPNKSVTPRHQYHIITGSFISRDNALKHIRELRQLGFSAGITGRSSKGYYRVSALHTSSKTEALEKLGNIRSEDFQNAWLLKK